MKTFYLGSKFVSEGNVPKCQVCGHELTFKKYSGNKYKIVTCPNENCKCHNIMTNKVRTLMVFGEDGLNEYNTHFKESRRLCKEYWIKKGFSEEEAIKEIKKLQSESSKKVINRGRCNREVMMEKLKDKEKVDEFFRRRSRYSIDYWTARGYSEDDAKIEISKLQTKNAQLQDFEHIREHSYRCKEYWMIRSGMTEEEAIKKISEIQVNFSLQKCIEKYGEEDGRKKWEERQKKWQESLHKSQNLHVGYSKISQDLFKTLENFYPKEERDYLFYGSKNHEYSLRSDDINYIYDYTDLNRRKMIEFNGDIYHGNPKIYKPEERPNPFKKDKTAKDLWDFDSKKHNVAIDNGFDEIVIWESDYRENKEKIIEECVKFLKLC